MAHAAPPPSRCQVFTHQHHMDVHVGGKSILGKMDRWINRLMGSEEEQARPRARPPEIRSPCPPHSLPSLPPTKECKWR